VSCLDITALVIGHQANAQGQGANKRHRMQDKGHMAHLNEGRALGKCFVVVYGIVAHLPSVN